MFLRFLIFTKNILPGCSWIVNPFWYGEGLDGGYFVTILIDMKFKESMCSLSSCVVVAKLYFAFFQSKTSPKWGLSSTKPHQKMFLEFSKLGLDCSLNITCLSWYTSFTFWLKLISFMINWSLLTHNYRMLVLDVRYFVFFW